MGLYQAYKFQLTSIGYQGEFYKSDTHNLVIKVYQSNGETLLAGAEVDIDEDDENTRLELNFIQPNKKPATVTCYYFPNGKRTYAKPVPMPRVIEEKN